MVTLGAGGGMGWERVVLLMTGFGLCWNWVLANKRVGLSLYWLAKLMVGCVGWYWAVILCCGVVGWH